MAEKKGDGNVEEMSAAIDALEDAAEIEELIKDEKRITVVRHAVKRMAELAVAAATHEEDEKLEFSPAPRPKASEADAGWVKWAARSLKIPMEKVIGSRVYPDKVVLVTNEGRKYSAGKVEDWFVVT